MDPYSPLEAMVLTAYEVGSVVDEHEGLPRLVLVLETEGVLDVADTVELAIAVAWRKHPAQPQPHMEDCRPTLRPDPGHAATPYLWIPCGKTAYVFTAHLLPLRPCSAPCADPDLITIDVSREVEEVFADLCQHVDQHLTT